MPERLNYTTLKGFGCWVNKTNSEKKEVFRLISLFGCETLEIVRAEREKKLLKE